MLVASARVRVFLVGVRYTRALCFLVLRALLSLVVGGGAVSSSRGAADFRPCDARRCGPRHLVLTGRARAQAEGRRRDSAGHALVHFSLSPSWFLTLLISSDLSYSPSLPSPSSGPVFSGPSPFQRLLARLPRPFRRLCGRRPPRRPRRRWPEAIPREWKQLLQQPTQSSQANDGRGYGGGGGGGKRRRRQSPHVACKRRRQ